MKNKTIHFPVVGMKERIKYITLFDITLLIKVSYKSDDKNINLYIKDITTNRETENILIKSDFTEDDEIGKSVVANTDDGSIEILQTKLNKTKIELEKAKTNLTLTEQKLMLQLETAKTEYNYSIEEFETSKQNLALAERIESKQQIKFFEGISTSFELSESQRQLYTMQQNYLQTMLTIIANKAALDNALNTPINN